MFFYSFETSGFYLADVHGQNMPTDVIEITEEEKSLIHACQAAGGNVTRGQEGRPQCQMPGRAAEVQNTLQLARSQRQSTIAVLDGLQSSALTKGDTAAAGRIEAAKQALRDITKVDLSSAKTREDMEALLLDEYRAIVAGVPDVAAVFRELLA